MSIYRSMEFVGRLSACEIPIAPWLFLNLLVRFCHIQCGHKKGRFEGPKVHSASISCLCIFGNLVSVALADVAGHRSRPSPAVVLSAVFRCCLTVLTPLAGHFCDLIVCCTVNRTMHARFLHVVQYSQVRSVYFSWGWVTVVRCWYCSCVFFPCENLCMLFAILTDRDADENNIMVPFIHYVYRLCWVCKRIRFARNERPAINSS